MKLFLISTTLLLFLAACGGKKTTTLPNLINATDTTDECKFMLEVCGEARDFEREFFAMDEDDKKNMSSVMSSYAGHCEEAEVGCAESVKE